MTTRGASVAPPELPGPPLAQQLPPGQKVRHITGLREAADWLPWFVSGGGQLPREIKAGGKEILAGGRGPYSVVIELDPRRVTGRLLHAKSEVYGLNHIGPDAVTAFVVPNPIALRRYRAKPGMEEAFDFENARKVKHGYRVLRRTRPNRTSDAESKYRARHTPQGGDDAWREVPKVKSLRDGENDVRRLEAYPGPEDTPPATTDPWSEGEKNRQRHAAERAHRELRGIEKPAHADFSLMSAKAAEQIIDELKGLQQRFNFTIDGIHPSSSIVWWGPDPKGNNYFETDGFKLAYGVNRWHPSALEATLKKLQQQNYTSQASKTLAAVIYHEVCHMLIRQAISRRKESVGDSLLENSIKWRVERYRKTHGKDAIIKELGHYAWWGPADQVKGKHPAETAWSETIAQAFSAYLADPSSVSKATADLVEYFTNLEAFKKD